MSDRKEKQELEEQINTVGDGEELERNNADEFGEPTKDNDEK